MMALETIVVALKAGARLGFLFEDVEDSSEGRVGGGDLQIVGTFDPADVSIVVKKDGAGGVGEDVWGLKGGLRIDEGLAGERDVERFEKAQQVAVSRLELELGGREGGDFVVCSLGVFDWAIGEVIDHRPFKGRVSLGREDEQRREAEHLTLLCARGEPYRPMTRRGNPVLSRFLRKSCGRTDLQAHPAHQSFFEAGEAYTDANRRKAKCRRQLLAGEAFKVVEL